MPISKEKLIELYKALPDDVAAVYEGANTGEILVEIGRKHALAIDLLGRLSYETGLVLVGASPAREFIDNVQKGLGLTRDKAVEVAQDVNHRLFAPIRESLKQIHKIGPSESLIPEESFHPDARDQERKVAPGPMPNTAGPQHPAAGVDAGALKNLAPKTPTASVPAAKMATPSMPTAAKNITPVTPIALRPVIKVAAPDIPVAPRQSYWQELKGEAPGPQPKEKSLPAGVSTQPSIEKTVSAASNETKNVGPISLPQPGKINSPAFSQDTEPRVNPVRMGASRLVDGSITPPSAISISTADGSRRRSNGGNNLKPPFIPAASPPRLGSDLGARPQNVREGGEINPAPLTKTETVPTPAAPNAKPRGLATQSVLEKEVSAIVGASVATPREPEVKKSTPLETPRTVPPPAAKAPDKENTPPQTPTPLPPKNAMSKPDTDPYRESIGS